MKCDALKADMTAWRHDFHHHPELGFQEYRTSRIIAKLLTSFGLKVYEKIGGTGVVAVLQAVMVTAVLPLGLIWMPCPSTKQEIVTINPHMMK